MSTDLALILALVATIGIFGLICFYTLNIRINAGYIIGYSLFFDMFGFMYQQYMPGNALILLVAVPLLPVAISFLRKGRDGDLIQDIGVWLWLILILYAILTLLWTPPGAEGMYKLTILIARGLIPGIYAYIIYKKYRSMSWSIVAIFGLAYAITHLSFGEYSTEYPGRLALPGGNPIISARLSLVAVSVALWGKGIHPLLRIIVIVTAGASALATESRGPIVAFLAANGLIAAYIFIRKYRREGFQKLVPFVMLLSMLLISAGIAASQYSTEIKDWVMSTRFVVLFDQNQLQSDDNFIGRVELQKKALLKWEEHPFVGAGLGSVTPPLTRDFPHNVILEIASELGIIGLSIWTIAFVYSFWSARRHMIVLVILLQTIGTALISGDFGYNYEYLLFAFVALALAQEQTKEVFKHHDESAIPDYRS